MILSATQRRYLRNLRDRTGLDVRLVRRHVLERDGLIERVGSTWEITQAGRLALHLAEVELYEKGQL